MDGTSQARRRLVIVGNGMAGSRLIGEVQRRAPGRYDIVIVGAEATPAYDRILLSSVLAGDKKLADIMLAAASPEVMTFLGEAATDIVTDTRHVRTVTGRMVAYDSLVLATGSTPIMLGIPGAALPGVVTFRDVFDVERMIGAARDGAPAVVIGGGLLGLEAAEGLRRRGMSVTVVHLMSSLMERQLDEAAAGLLQATLAGRGISFVLPAETAAILGENRAEGVQLKDGRVLPADLVVMAVGIKPNADLARQAGLTCGRGVVVDDALRTSDPAIFAVGECVEHRGRSYGLVAPLWDQVAVCAAQLADDATALYAGSTVATSLKVIGVAMYSAGELSAPDGEEIVLSDPGRGVYRKLVLRDGRLRGAVLYGDTADGGWYLDLMRDGCAVEGVRGDLVFGKAFAGDIAAAG
jgi:nitrite reductase (NADH) large subunit